MDKVKLRNCFICNNCRDVCGAGCYEQKERYLRGDIDEANKDLTPRKQLIRCLGKFCDTPCCFNDPEAYKEIPYETLFEQIKYLADKCGEYIEENNKLRAKVGEGEGIE